MFYVPDFYLKKFDTWLEVKGYWRDDAIRKYTEFTNKYNVKIKVIEEEAFIWLIARYKDIICLEN